MINFPVLCMDNFYDDPDSVREFALKQKFYPTPGNYPGLRTDSLYEIDPTFYRTFVNKLFSIYYPNQQFNCKVFSSFWRVRTLDPDPQSPKNMGWIHEDGCLMAGVVYLTPGFDKTLGTTIYKQIATPPNPNGAMHRFYRDRIDDNFDQAILSNNASYEETVVVSNNYNRLICFDGRVPHGPSGYYMGNEERLVQVFFVRELDTAGYPPSKRVGIVEKTI